MSRNPSSNSGDRRRKQRAPQGQAPPAYPAPPPAYPPVAPTPPDWDTAEPALAQPYEPPPPPTYGGRPAAPVTAPSEALQHTLEDFQDDAVRLEKQTKQRPVSKPGYLAHEIINPESPTERVMILVILFLVGVGLVALPFTNLLPGLANSWAGQAVLVTMGLLLLFMVAVIAIVTRLYRKASANMAYVKTGMGGAKVIQDRGALIIPVVHQVIPVSLETMRLNVERRGTHALITKDNLRVDLSAEFYIKVQANADDILQAARSLGGRNVQPDAVSELVQEKLVSALRTVAATKDLVELHSKRDEFASAVQQIVTHDLASNGLTLESVTISALDQTDPSQLQERNVFDAQGLRKIAQITQQAKVERNEIEQES